MKVLILKGLPGSGKSTFAKKLVNGDIKAMGQDWVRVNKDELRAMIDNGKWSKSHERFIIAIRDLIVVEALSAGRNVVVDDTNLHPKHEKDLHDLVASFKPDVEVKFFDTPLEVCIERDLKRPVSVGQAVIMRMYKSYLKPSPGRAESSAPEYVPVEGKPNAIIVDIDGTLAHMVTDRSPYDYARAHEDELDEVVSHIVKSYADDHKYKVIICSGREDDCKRVTEEWLAAKGIRYDELLMRVAGDHRKDSIVKREIFEAHIRPKYNVKFVLDDRNQVVDMWRNELGLKVLQVAEGDF